MIVTIDARIGGRQSRVGIKRSGDDFVVSMNGSILEHSPAFDAALGRAGRELREFLSAAQRSEIQWGLMVTACGVTAQPFGTVDFGFVAGGGGVAADLEDELGPLLRPEPKTPFEAVAKILEIARAICWRRGAV